MLSYPSHWKSLRNKTRNRRSTVPPAATNHKEIYCTSGSDQSQRDPQNLRLAPGSILGDARVQDWTTCSSVCVCVCVCVHMTNSSCHIYLSRWLLTLLWSCHGWVDPKGSVPGQERNHSRADGSLGVCDTFQRKSWQTQIAVGVWGSIVPYTLPTSVGHGCVSWEVFLNSDHG